MDSKLEAQLVKKYPKIFADIGKTPQESCMAFGCECSDGWYDLLDKLCGMIQSHIDQNLGMDQYPQVPQVKADQIKEKYGGLRFYFSGGDDYIYGLIDMTCCISETTCEVCGNKGKLRDGGWIKCRCDECEAKEHMTI